MKLFYRHFGNGWPLIIIHGLYGSSDNWLSIAKKLEDHFSLYLVDLRNHGNSPHSDIHSYEAMASDLLEMVNELSIKRPIIIGHSMGGKVAMRLGLQYPELIQRMIVVDISPISNFKDPSKKIGQGHSNIISAMRNLPVSSLDNRKDADSLLSERIPSERERNFLLKNLTREDGHFKWRLNLDVLAKNIDELMNGFDISDTTLQNQREFPILFIKGEKSEYINKKDKEAIKTIYPTSKLVTITNAGHWVHAEQPEAFTSEIMNFCSEEADFF